jgi:hypothetical protein
MNVHLGLIDFGQNFIHKLPAKLKPIIMEKNYGIYRILKNVKISIEKRSDDLE